MTTLKHLAKAVDDMRDGLQREQAYSSDAKRGLLAGILLLRDCADALERDIRRHFEERDRSVDVMLGITQAEKPEDPKSLTQPVVIGEVQAHTIVAPSPVSGTSTEDVLPDQVAPFRRRKAE